MSSSKQTSGEELPLVAGQETGAPATPRRSLLIQFITAAISVVIVAVPATLGGLFFLDPIIRKRKATKGDAKVGELHRKDDAGFIRLDITRDAVPEDGTPVAITVLPPTSRGLSSMITYLPESDFLSASRAGASLV